MSGAKLRPLVPIIVMISFLPRGVEAPASSVAPPSDAVAATATHALAASSPGSLPPTARATDPGPVPGARWR
jgi:hypothetical protein